MDDTAEGRPRGRRPVRPKSTSPVKRPAPQRNPMEKSDQKQLEDVSSAKGEADSALSKSVAARDVISMNTDPAPEKRSRFDFTARDREVMREKLKELKGKDPIKEDIEELLPKLDSSKRVRRENEIKVRRNPTLVLLPLRLTLDSGG